MSTAVTLVLIGSIAVAAYYEREYRHMGRALDADADALRAYRWERPVLRGTFGEGNAADEIYAALATWKPLPRGTREALAQKVYYGSLLTAAESDMIDARAATLRALRRATQQGWSRSELAPERGLSMRVPDYPRIIEVGLALLADAQTQTADECLQASADLIRIGQDLVPAAPLEAASTSLQLTTYAARVIARCAARADAAGLRRASHELRTIASHPAPIGSSIELEEVASAMDLRERAALTDKPSPIAVGVALIERPQLMAAWSNHDSPARFRRISAERYPDSLEEWQREQNYRAGASQAQRRIQDDMHNQALLRMLA
ncbi:MAG TPA: hypothetical protein VHZ95_03700, partial [Polyangiales bacterium]|nr:hypothetical protein [Polyangiales bacterium]